MARGIGARRSSELYGGLLGDYLRRAGGLLAERAGEVISGQALEEYIQSLFPGFGAYQITDGQITFPEARAPQGGAQGLLGEMLPGGGVAGTIAGVGARTADRGLLAIAEEAEQSGLPMRKIQDATGWWRGKDGKWRFEIDDGLSYIPPTVSRDIKAGTKYLQMDTVSDADIAAMRNMRDSWNADEFLSHEGLFGAYPNIRGTKVQLEGDLGSRGAYSEEYNQIGISPMTIGEMHSTGLHELNHAIQSQENFAKGGSAALIHKEVMDDIRSINDSMSAYAKELDLAENFKGGYRDMPLAERKQRIKDLEDAYMQLMGEREVLISKGGTIDQALNTYKRLAGEAEARNVQARRFYTPDYRRMHPFQDSFDIPESRQIVVLGRNGEGLLQP